MKKHIYHIELLIKRLLLAMVLFSIGRLFFLLLNLQHFSDLAFFEGIKLFFFGMRFDLSALIILNVFFVLLHLLPGDFKSNRRYQLALKLLFVSVNSVLVLCNFADAEFFKFTNKRSSAFVLDLIWSSDMNNDAVRLLPQFAKDYWFIFVGCLAASIGAWRFYPSLSEVRLDDIERQRGWASFERERTSFERGWTSLGMQLFISFLVLLILVVVGRGGLQRKPLRIINAAEYTDAKYVQLVLNTPFTMMKTYGKSGVKKVAYMDESELKQYFDPIYEPSRSGGFKKTNVVVLIMESFSTEFVGAISGRESHTPFLDSLVKKGLIFDHGFANGTLSIEAIPIVLASIPPLMETPYITSHYASNKATSFANLLKDKKYSTSFFHGATNGSMGFGNFVYSVGFDRYFGMDEYGRDEDYDGKWGIPDNKFLQYMVKQLSQEKQPFFSAVFTLTSHHPYKVPDEFKSRFNGGKIKIHKVVEYADFALKNFFDAAKQTDWYDNTLFVIVADHTASHGQSFYPEFQTKTGSYRVPILLYHPSDPTLKGVNSSVMQQVDILPTVMDYMGYDKRFFSFGQNAFDRTGKKFAVSYRNGIYQMIDEQHVLLFDGKKCIALYDWRNDALSKNNLLSQRPELASSLLPYLKSYIQQYNNSLVENKMAVD